MKFLTRSVMLGIMMLASVAMFAQKGGGNEELKAAIQDYNNAMADAMIKGDYETVYSYYDDKVISMPNYGEMMRGKEALKAHQKEAAAKGNKVISISLKTKKVTDYGDVVVEIGFYQISFKIAEMPNPINDSGKYLTVWKKDGTSYKILNEIWNTNVHPMAAAKKGGDKPSPALEDDKGSGLEPAKKTNEEIQKEQGQLKSGGKKKGSNKKPKPDDQDRQ